MAPPLTRAEHLLPPNASESEQRLAALTARIGAVPAPIDLLKRPLETPSTFLPFLGWEDSVDVWSAAWPEARKRAVVDAALRLHMRKGTAYVIREYVRYTDNEIRSIERPPRKVFSGPTLTREERETWLSGLPQIRTWRIRDPGTKGFALYSSGFGFASFFEAGFPVPSTALQRLRRRARWVVDGEETDVRVTDSGGYFRIHLASTACLRVFSGRLTPAAYYQPSTASQRLVTIRPSSRLSWRYPVGPTLEPTSVEPERVVVNGDAGPAVFCDRTFGGRHFIPSTAAYRVYWRFAVHDGRRINRRSPVQFMSVGRYGFPAHTAHLEIGSPRRRQRWHGGEGINSPRTRFWIPHDPRPIQAARRAITAAKRLSDQILIRFPDRGVFVAGRMFRAGIDSTGRL